MFIRFIMFIIRLLPHSIALSFGRSVGRLLRIILWKKTDRCESRCVMSLGVGITIARGIIRNAYINLGMSIIEFIRLPIMKPRIKDYVKFSPESVKRLHDAISQGKGVIVMDTHMGNWEICAVRVAAEGFEVCPIVTPQRNDAGVNDIINELRSLTPEVRTIDSEKGLRETFKTLKSGGVVVVMQDLDARKDGIIMNFLGMPASTHDGIVKLYRKFKCPVIPARFIRDKDNPSHHEVRVYEDISTRHDRNGNAFGEDMQGSLEICNDVIESWIRERPELWFWLMDKWEYVFRLKAKKKTEKNVN